MNSRPELCASIILTSLKRQPCIEMELPPFSTTSSGKSKNSTYSSSKKRRFRMVFVAAAAAMVSALCCGYSTVYTGPATYDMQTRKGSRIKITDDEVFWAGSVVPAGIMVTVPLAAYFTDKIGRKDTIIFLSCIPSVVSWLITIYAPNALFFLVGRFISGLGVSAVYVALPVYAVEISSADTRGLIGSSFQASVTIGTMMVMGFGAVLAWSWLAVGGLVLAVASIIALIPMPQSPRWLVAKGRKEQAIEALAFLHADHLDAELECQMIENAVKTQTKSKFSIQNLKQPIVYKPALISMGQMTIVPFTGAIVVLTFSSLILSNAKSTWDPKQATVVLGATQLVATLLSTTVVDRAGRKPLLLVSGFLMSLSHAVLGAYFYMLTHDSTISSKVGWLPAVSLTFFIAVFSIGFGPIPFLMISEMVPSRERGFINGAAMLVMSGLAFVVIKTFVNLINAIHFYGVFWMFSTVCFLSCIFVYFLVPETKGKQLEEIQLIFSGRKASVEESGKTQSPEEGVINPAFSVQ